MRKEYYKVFKQNIPQLLQLRMNGKSCHFHVLHAENENYAGDRTFSRKEMIKKIHSHPVYHFILYTGGQNTFHLDGKSYPSYRGTLAVTSPGAPHFFGACEPGNVQSVEITFALEDVDIPDKFYSIPFCRLLSDLSGIPLKEVEFPVNLDEPLFQKAHSALNELLENLGKSFYPEKWVDVEMSIMKIIIFLIRQVYLARHLKENHDEEILQNIKAFIESNFNNPLNLSGLVKKTPFSARHFSRLFKDHFGHSPVSYQHFLRLNTAKTLLISSPYRINEIAEKVGYGDVYQFSKMFKKRFKLSPRKLRMQS